MNGPFEHSTPEELTADRLRLHANGYHPVPANGKRPIMDAWQDVCQTAGPEEIAGWVNEKPDHLNTGILCGTVVGIDIDVVDEMLSGQLVARALEIFGPTSLRRIGRAPKTLLVYRVLTPITKLQTSALLFGNDPNTKAEADKCKVEILAEGQHFVALGIHPDTRLAYRWPEKTPLDVSVADVPLVSVEALKQFVDEAETVLRAAGARTAREIKGKTKPGKSEKKNRDRQQRSGKIHAGLFPDEKPSREVINDALNHIPNDMDWEEWYRIGYALYDGLGEAGRDLWEEWSAKSPKNDSRTTAEYWPRFAGGVGREGAGVTVGTLFWHAKENGWKGGAGWITLNDLYAYLPHHSYIYTPTGDLWPAVTVNSQLPSMPVFAKDGTRAHGPATKDNG
jgi:putative DNA primase/helicase